MELIKYWAKDQALEGGTCGGTTPRGRPRAPPRGLSPWAVRSQLQLHNRSSGRKSGRRFIAFYDTKLPRSTQTSGGLIWSFPGLRRGGSCRILIIATHLHHQFHDAPTVSANPIVGLAQTMMGWMRFIM